MRWTHWIMLLCLTTSLSAMASDNAAIVWPDGTLERTAQIIGSLDDPQPDTLQYDNNSPASLSTTTNFWVRVRFTAPVDFSIISAYAYTIDGTTSPAPCSLFVYTAIPAPGGEQALAVKSAPLPDFGWFDVNFNDTVTVTGGSDFYVVMGPVPGGPQFDTNWNPVYDNGITGDRSQISTQTKYGTYSLLGGDVMLRIGGIAGGVFTDLSAGDLANEVNGAPSYNFELGEDVLFNQVVENIGTSAVDAYVVEFSIEGPGGGSVFSEDIIGGALAAGGTATLATSNVFTPAEEGEYLARSVVLAGEDNNSENDTSWVRFFVGGNHRWYRYDDDETGDADSYLGFSVGSGWALKFTPAEYPAKITQFKINVGGNATGDFRFYMIDNATGLPAGAPLWTSTPAVVQGWNTVNVTPNVTLFEGQSIAAAYLYQTGAAMGFDNDAPNCAENAAMGIIAFQVASSGGQFFEDDGGNLLMQVYMDTSSATPPFAVIDTDVDTLDFGAAHPAWDPLVMPLWVYNRGGQDALNVTSITITPGSTAPAYHVAPTAFTVAAGDSEEVMVEFDPPIHRTWNGLLTINSNAGNNAAYPVLVRGRGDTTLPADAVQELDLPLPNQFSLSQNYPNPFNPS
ncbi:MAG: hypothetical protein H6506_02790, partial [Calditrichaeota bacterium]|nr:hypothetical protein [Calditrichota bacterium]